MQPVDPIVLQRLSELRVVGECACGCGSVDFVEGEARLQSWPIAEGTGKTAADGDVEIIVWGTASVVTGLEVLDRGAGDHDIRLPAPASIIPW